MRFYRLYTSGMGSTRVRKSVLRPHHVNNREANLFLLKQLGFTR